MAWRSNRQMTVNRLHEAPKCERRTKRIPTNWEIETEIEHRDRNAPRIRSLCQNTGRYHSGEIFLWRIWCRLFCSLLLCWLLHECVYTTYETLNANRFSVRMKMNEHFRFFFWPTTVRVLTHTQNTQKIIRILRWIYFAFCRIDDNSIRSARTNQTNIQYHSICIFRFNNNLLLT